MRISIRIMARMESGGNTIPEKTEFEDEAGHIKIAQFAFDFLDKHELKAGLESIWINVSEKLYRMRRLMR